MSAPTTMMPTSPSAAALIHLRTTLARLHLVCDAMGIQTSDVRLGDLHPEALQRLYALAEGDLRALLAGGIAGPEDVYRDPERARRLREALAPTRGAPRPEGPT